MVTPFDTVTILKRAKPFDTDFLPETVHRNDPKRKIFCFDIQFEMATETEFKTLILI